MALPGDIEAARTTAQTAGSALGELTAGGYTIGDELKKRVQEAYDYNKDIIGPLDTATLAYTGAPTEARSIFSDPTSERYVFNPFQQEQLVSQYTQGKALPMLALGSILGQRMGRIEDLIGAGTRAYQANTARAQSDFDVKQQLYQNLLNEYQVEQAGYSQATIDDGGRKYLITYDSQGNVVNRQDIGEADKSGGSGSSYPDLSWLADILGSSGNVITAQPTPEEAKQTPVLFDPTTGQHYTYDTVNDPDYWEDIQRGFKLAEGYY